jgi:hypothetical protein
MEAIVGAKDQIFICDATTEHESVDWGKSARKLSSNHLARTAKGGSHDSPEPPYTQKELDAVIQMLADISHAQLYDNKGKSATAHARSQRQSKNYALEQSQSPRMVAFSKKHLKEGSHYDSDKDKYLGSDVETYRSDADGDSRNELSEDEPDTPTDSAYEDTRPARTYRSSDKVSVSKPSQKGEREGRRGKSDTSKSDPRSSRRRFNSSEPDRGARSTTRRSRSRTPSAYYDSNSAVETISKKVKKIDLKSRRDRRDREKNEPKKTSHLSQNKEKSGHLSKGKEPRHSKEKSTAEKAGRSNKKVQSEEEPSSPSAPDSTSDSDNASKVPCWNKR